MTDNADTRYTLYAYVCECGRVERVYMDSPDKKILFRKREIVFEHTARDVLDSRPNKCRYAVVKRNGGVAVLDTYKLMVDPNESVVFGYARPLYAPPEAFTQYASLEQALMATVLTYTNN